MPAQHSTRSIEQVTIIAGTEARPGWRLPDTDGNDWSWAYVIHRPIPEWPSYTAGSDGSVWSMPLSKHHRPRSGEPRRLKAAVVPPGRMLVKLSVARHTRCFYVHRLVLTAFVGPRPEGKEGCHNDGNPANNSLANLRWDTHQSNVRDAAHHGTQYRGERHWKAKLGEDEVRLIRQLGESGRDYAEIGLRFGVSEGTVEAIVRRYTWKHVS